MQLINILISSAQLFWCSLLEPWHNHLEAQTLTDPSVYKKNTQHSSQRIHRKNGNRLIFNRVIPRYFTALLCTNVQTPTMTTTSKAQNPQNSSKSCFFYETVPYEQVNSPRRPTVGFRVDQKIVGRAGLGVKKTMFSITILFQEKITLFFL